GADPGLLEQVAADTRGEEILPPQAAIRQIACLHVKDPDVVIRLTSDEFRAGADGHLPAGIFIAMDSDPACEERDQIRAAGEARDIEDASALKEEGALLRKEQWKSGEVDLTDVRLGFREIRVHGNRGVHVRGQVLEHVEAARELAVAGVFSA